MLVITRKKNQSIVINQDITLTVVEVHGEKVRLGIVAPKEVPVHRQEVFDAIFGKPGAEPAPSTLEPAPKESEPVSRDEELDVLSREVLLFEEDGNTSSMTVN
jgi:carbon storage regulator